jgi:hypothetical protein
MVTFLKCVRRGTGEGTPAYLDQPIPGVVLIEVLPVEPRFPAAGRMSERTNRIIKAIPRTLI